MKTFNVQVISFTAYKSNDFNVLYIAAKQNNKIDKFYFKSPAGKDISDLLRHHGLFRFTITDQPARQDSYKGRQVASYVLSEVLAIAEADQPTLKWSNEPTQQIEPSMEFE